MGWLGKKNGELLGLIVFNGFDFFVTLDKNLRYQHNLERIELKILLLLAINNCRETLQVFVQKTKEKIKEGNLQKLNEISCIVPPTAKGSFIQYEYLKKFVSDYL
jgi:hypothetical protein